MYIIIEKNTNIVVHRNEAPLSQNLTGTEIYYQYDPSNYKIGKTDDNEIKEKIVLNQKFPNEYKIINNNNIIEKTIEEKIQDGLITLQPTKKFKKGEIIEKTIDEKAQEELITAGEYREYKISKLRLIRERLLTSTIWRLERHCGELKGIDRGVTTKPTSLTAEKFDEWLLYWEVLRDLPETINIDIFNYKDIIESNTNIFPVQPE